jgi:MbtH protein
MTGFVVPIGCGITNKGARSVFGIVVNDEDQFSVWPTHRRLPIGWRYTGPTGTRAQMHELVRQHFVETIPSTYISRESRHRDSSWAD